MNVRAYAPAGIGNFAAGFDLLGAALAPLDGLSVGGSVEIVASAADTGWSTVRPLRRPAARPIPQETSSCAPMPFREALRPRGVSCPPLQPSTCAKTCRGAAAWAPPPAPWPPRPRRLPCLVGDPLFVPTELLVVAGRAEGLVVRRRPPGQRGSPAPLGGLQLLVPSRRRSRSRAVFPGPTTLVLIVVLAPLSRLATARSAAGAPHAVPLSDAVSLRPEPGRASSTPWSRATGLLVPLPAGRARRAPPGAPHPRLPRRPDRGFGSGGPGAHASPAPGPALFAVAELRKPLEPRAKPFRTPSGRADRRSPPPLRPRGACASLGARVRREAREHPGPAAPGRPPRFRQAVLAGIAPGGGLYMPMPCPVFDDWPELSPSASRSARRDPRPPLRRRVRRRAEVAKPCARRSGLPRPARPCAARSSTPWSCSTAPPWPSRTSAPASSPPAPPPVRQPDRPVTILTATSGDTGAAVARAFWQLPRRPRRGPLSAGPRLRRSRKGSSPPWGTTCSPSPWTAAFDDCQALVKACLRGPRSSPPASA